MQLGASDHLPMSIHRSLITVEMVCEFTAHVNKESQRCEVPLTFEDKVQYIAAQGGVPNACRIVTLIADYLVDSRVRLKLTEPEILL